MEEKTEPKVIDAGSVVLLIDGAPVPLPALFQEMFKILKDLDHRLMKLEEKTEDKRIITLD